MTPAAAELLVTALGLYALAGALFALFFVTLGAKRIDPDAAGMPLRARLVVFPGAAGLWPLLLVKVLMGRGLP